MFTSPAPGGGHFFLRCSIEDRGEVHDVENSMDHQGSSRLRWRHFRDLRFSDQQQSSSSFSAAVGSLTAAAGPADVRDQPR